MAAQQDQGAPGDRLSWRTRLLYGVGDIGNAVVNSAVQFFLLAFYTDGALIEAGLASTALWVAKFWDAVNDPLFGWLSDRTSSRFGKRRAYMIFGALPLAFSVALLWVVPQGLSNWAMFLWIVFTFVLFDTFWTLTNAHYLMGEVERVYAWIDRSPVVPTKYVDAPATIMFQFKSPRRYGVLDFAHTPNMRIDSLYYADDNRLEVIGDRGILLINRCTARTLDLPELLMFRDGRTTAIPVEGVEWHDNFIGCTRHLVDVLQQGGAAVLDGSTGRAVLQFALAAQLSACTGREVRPDEVG